MEIIKDIDQMRLWRVEQAKQNLSVGFVPTMGDLHEAHHTLVNKAKKSAERVVLSIFVNPLQFNESKDFRLYPRPLKRDIERARDWDIDVLFCPSAEQIYPKAFSTTVQESSLSKPLCGKSRPGHFQGVLTVVVKLFNLVEPTMAVFGQKDYQQYLLIEKMVRDLNMDIQVEMCPVIRDLDGLAISSRNKRLNKRERQDALVLNEALFVAKIAIQGGEKDAVVIKNKIRKMMKAKKNLKIDYIEIVDAKDLNTVKKLKGKIVIALAVEFKNTRLIDNLLLNV